MSAFTYKVDISAPAEAIWSAWMDVERWPEWAPPMKKVELVTPGPLQVGSRVRIEAEGAPAALWEVTDLRPHEFFEWATSVRGVKVSAGHGIEVGKEKCTVTLSIEYGGLMATLFRPMLMRTARRNVPAEGLGLRDHCEAQEGGGGD
jgi:uncharacterized membrane protein